MVHIGRPHTALPYPDGAGIQLVEDPPDSGLYTQTSEDED